MSSEFEKAKRAILGLCDYDMDSAGTLTRIEPNRNRNYVFPKGCKIIGKSAITLRTDNPKIILGDKDIIFEKDFLGFCIPPKLGTFQIKLTLDLTKSRFNTICSFAQVVPEDEDTAPVDVGIDYVFDENMFAEQIVAVLAVNKYKERLQFFSGGHFLIDKTIMTTEFRNINFFKKVYETLMKFYYTSDDMKKRLQKMIELFKEINYKLYAGAVKV